MSGNPGKTYYSTTELLSKFKPAFTNLFNVNIPDPSTGESNDDVSFMAYEAVLPGTSYELGSVYGDRQGRTEYYPTRRVYPPVDISFYVDKDYKIIKFFEGWINAISKNEGNSRNSYVTHYYPSSYEREVVITKFEREFFNRNQRLSSKADTRGLYRSSISNYVTYTLRNAFPSNLISLPVSYEGNTVLKTTVTFQYDVYNFKDGNFETEGNDGQTIFGPGGDETETTAAAVSPNVNPDNPIQGSLLTPEEYARAYTQGFEQSFGGKENVPSKFKSQDSNDLLSTYQRQSELLNK